MRKRRIKSSPVLGRGYLLAFLALVAIGVLIWLALIIGRFIFSPGEELAEVLVPNVVGKELTEAETILNQVNLGLVVEERAFSEEIPAGKIIRQHPSANMKVRVGRVVRVILSLGPPTLQVPSVIGKSLREAQEAILRAKLLVGKVEKVYLERKARGEVIAQQPAGGKSFTNPVRVDLVVTDATPEDRTVVPALKNMPLAGAEKELHRRNLVLASVHYVYEGGEKVGTVIEQEPSAGAEVPLGTAVKLKVQADPTFKHLKVRTYQLRFSLPASLPAGTLKIELQDAIGKQIIYEGKVNPGDQVEQVITTEEYGYIRIFWNGKLLREDKV